MSSRVFQSVVLQMKDSTDRAIGVIDSEGTVVACNELTCIGEKWTGAVEAINEADTELVAFDGNTFKPLAGWSSQFDYAAFARGEDDAARMVCSMAAVALNGAKAYYEEKHDKATFVKSIISDNILLGDIYVRAKELHFTSEAPRAVFLVRQVGTTDMAAIDVVQSLFPDKQVDFVLSINETDIALIKQLSDGTESKDLYKVAEQVEALSGRVRVYALVETLRYLVLGGRLSKAAGLVGSALNLKPIITLKGGVLSAVGKARGTRAAVKLLRELVDANERIDTNYPVYYGHAFNDEGIALLQQAFPEYPAKAPVLTVGCIVGTHTGPKVTAISFISEVEA